MVSKLTLCQQHHLNDSNALMKTLLNTHLRCSCYTACSFRNAIAFSCFVKVSSLPGTNISTDLPFRNYWLLAVISQGVTLWKGLRQDPLPLCLDPDARPENICSSETSGLLQVSSGHWKSGCRQQENVDANTQRNRVLVFHTLRRLISQGQYKIKLIRNSCQKLFFPPKINDNFNVVGCQDIAIPLMITPNPLPLGWLLCGAQLADTWQGQNPIRTTLLTANRHMAWG